MNLLSNMVREIRVETAWSPALIINDPFAESPPSPAASAVGSFLRPRLTLVTGTGAPLMSAPWGDPGESRWPIVQATLVAAAFLGIAWFVSRQLKRY